MITLDAIASLLATHAGFDVESVGRSHLKSAVEKRLRLRDLSSEASYLNLLHSEPWEINELVEASVVRETRFFRDTAVFEAAAEWASDWGRAHPQQTLRVLSAPCASGEEAWSLASILRDVEIPGSRISIDAEDISREAIQAAQKGIYRAGSFRGVDENRRRQVAREEENGWHVDESLRPLVNFRVHNLLQEDTDDRIGHYHLIFCRNLLIYLNSEARGQLIGSLHRMLHPDGRLVIGSGDFMPEILSCFSPVKPASSFALTPHRPVDLAPAKEERHSPRQVEDAIPGKPPTKAPVGTNDDSFYARAQFYLSEGDALRAERSCRQALYLNPTHVPSLELLSSLWKEQGSPRLRRALNNRLTRVRQEAAP